MLDSVWGSSQVKKLKPYKFLDVEKCDNPVHWYHMLCDRENADILVESFSVNRPFPSNPRAPHGSAKHYGESVYINLSELV